MPKNNISEFSKREKLIIALLLITAALTALKLLHIDYMVNHSTEPYESFCNINEAFNCDLVAASRYSHLFGVPVALYGVLGDLLLLIFLFLGSRFAILRANLPAIFLLTFLFKTAGCLVLASISLLFLPSHCILCMLYWLLNIVTFVYLVSIQRRTTLNPKAIVSSTITGLWGQKWLTSSFLLFFLAGIVGAYYYLRGCSCELRDLQSLACHNYDSKTNTPFLGSSTGRLEIFLYTDFECPWCSRAHSAAVELVKRYEKQVKLIRRDFPLDQQCNRAIPQPFHAFACQAAYYARCAGAQGNYWQYHDELYQAQRDLSLETFRNIAKLLGLDLERLEACVDLPDIQQAVSNDIEEALKYGVKATPSFRIGDQIYTGVLTEETLEKYLRSYPALPEGKSTLHSATPFVHSNDALPLLSVGEAKALLANYSPLLLDLRTKEMFNERHLPGAINIPLESLSERWQELAEYRQKKILLICRTTNRSIRAYQQLRDLGFKDILIAEGGMVAWDG